MKPALLLILALVATPALARDQKAANACAAKLTPEGKAMFEATAPEVKADSDLRELMRSKVIPLVMFGSLTREAAEANGPAAGACAALLK
jgi:chemotaxis response regulator CheB